MGSVLYDSSTKGNNANTVNGVGWAAGAANLPPLKFPDVAALNINGGYAFAGINGLPATNDKQTISVWALLRQSTGADQYIVSLWSQAQSQSLDLGIRAGQVEAWKWGPSPLVATAAPPLNDWHHIAYTYDGATHRLYLDGRQVDMSTIAPDVAPLDHAQIGTYNGGSLFNGILDDLRIYNVALSATQVGRLAAGEFNAGDDSGSGAGGTSGSGGTAGSGGANGSGGAMLTFAKDIQPMLFLNCAPCHTTAGDGGMSVMAAPTSAMGVLGTVSAAHTNCAFVDASKKRIVAGDPTKSYLYAKVTKATAALGANCGNGMPNGKPQISMANQMLIMNWIMQGAN